ncbi:MAG: tRNA pseudouridine(38-40) synthase TruA [Coxiellaceae bacterium]|jgi:tRNA pseudouridine38-40 synthase|nr:tRNA pseudouridine(38-40) synthase TruA [Coxiellaceae bacterium]
MRIALGIEYDGTNYHGWQRQLNLVTLQEKVEEALSRIAAEKVTIACAGRTDAGVHAFGQVVHFDTKAERSDQAWILGTNSNLPTDIRILWARHMSQDFHARYSATSRCYRYIIYNNKVASALLRHRTMWCPYKLNEKLMREAGRYLLGEHDFSSFRGSGCQSRSVMRNVTLLEVTRGGAAINIDIQANAFLLHMVRNIVGVLLKIGIGEHPPFWVKEVLDARNRTSAAVTVPAAGLYLVKVEY